jgi:hypothetical protein
MSLKKCLGKVLIYLVLEIGALAGMPMPPDQLEQLMKIADQKVACVKRREDSDGNA